MINTWFTSDTHFGHANILEFEKEARPFKTLEEMHEVMIDRWNDCVRSNDIVYHLGDFCFGKANLAIAERLNGKKRLIMGNHDNYDIADYMLHFEKVMGVKYWKMCILSHIPVHPDSLGSRAFLNVHGHIHSKRVGSMSWKEYEDFPDQKVLTFTDDRNYFNVSCEQNNLMPFHADSIVQRLKEVGG